MVTSQGGYSGVRQSFMGSEAKHPIYSDLIEHIRISYEKKWYDVFTILYVQRTTGGETYKKILSNYKNSYFIIPNNLVYYCDSIDDCNVLPGCIAMMHFEKSWNLLLYLQRFIVYYKYIMAITICFLLYIIFGKCNSKGMETICSIKTILKCLGIVTFFYSILYLSMYGEYCRTSILYAILLFLSYASLKGKCDQCQL
jgi:hypothetical protein